VPAFFRFQTAPERERASKAEPKRVMWTLLLLTVLAAAVIIVGALQLVALR
jgi:hypothetical protein